MKHYCTLVLLATVSAPSLGTTICQINGQTMYCDDYGHPLTTTAPINAPANNFGAPSTLDQNFAIDQQNQQRAIELEQQRMELVRQRQQFHDEQMQRCGKPLCDQ